MGKESPLVTVTNFQLADEIRLSRKRSPSDFKTILNYSNTLTDGLRVRRGYAEYTGITWPVVNGVSLDASSLDVPMICQIENPEKTDVHILCMASIPQVWMFPYWRGSTKVTGSMALAESLTPGFIPTYAQVTTHSFGFQNWQLFAPYGSQTADYYNGWKIYNDTTGTSTVVTDFSAVDSGGGNIVATFTVADDISPTGLNWSNIHTYAFYRNYHDNHTFNPVYNVTLSDPPCAVADNSIIHFSGGQGVDPDANNSLKGSIIYPRMNKTFFPGLAETFTIDGTYVSEERCKGYDIVEDLGTAGTGSGSTALEAGDSGNTYWVGIAAIYDDGTIGELQKYETPADYTTVSQWLENYIQADDTNTIAVEVRIQAGTLNKTVQGFAIYLAQDVGDTRDSGRQTPYWSVGSISLTTESQNVFSGSGVWSYSAGEYAFIFSLTQEMWDEKGNTYETDSGMAEIQSDTSYAYSGRKVVGGRHYLYNVYVTSEAQADKQNLFTNPIGQNAAINSGITARRVFPNEQGFYRLRCEPDIGSRINAVVPMGFDEFLVLKNLGIVSVRNTVTQDLIPEHINRIVDHRIGCSTFHGCSVSNQEEIFFAGYDDCYSYRLGRLQPLIEREDKRDWLHTYREVLTNTQKENVVVIWLPQDYIMWTFGEEGSQYILDRGGWTQAAYKQTSGLTSTEWFKFPVKLNNGTVLALGTPGNTGLRQFQNPTTGGFYYTDDDTEIKSYLDSWYFNFGHNKDMCLSKIVFNRTFDEDTTGTLSIALYKDRALLRSYNPDSSLDRVYVFSVVGDSKIGFEWRYIYNNNSSPEVMGGDVLQIDSIEIYGELRPRSKRAAELVTITNVGVWDEDTWDGGTSWG